MLRMPFCGLRLAIQRLYAHFPHQRTHVLATHVETCLMEHIPEHTGTGKGIVQV